MSVTSAPDAGPVPKHLIPVLFIGVFMSALDTAIVGPAIPVLRQTFAVDNRMAGLVMSVYVLFALCSTALMANLSDRFGRKPVYLASVGLFALGSLLIAIAPSFWMLLASRAVQGLGAGGITPTASAVVGDVFAPQQRARMLGLMGATYGLAFVLGPPLASGLMLLASWHWIFLINLPIAALTLALGAKVLPLPRLHSARAPLDLRGIVLTFALLAALVLGITQVLDALVQQRLWPWLLLAAALLLALLVRLERSAQAPLIPMALFGQRQLATTYALAAGSGFGMGSVIFLASIATQSYGVSPQHAGFVLLPLVLCSMLGSGGSGRLLHRSGPRTMVLLGFALLVVGYGLTACTRVGLWLFLLASLPVGLGIGVLVGGALRSIAIDDAPAAVRAAAQGLINICTSIGTLVAAACIGAVADFGGGGSNGFGLAYAMVAAVMLLMLALGQGLRKKPGSAFETASA